MTSDITMTSAFDPPGIRLGVVRGISYGLFGPPGEFVPQARALGAGLIRAYLYWGQVEPEPGRYEWERASTRCSASSTATRRSGSRVCSAPRGRPGRPPTSCRRHRPTTRARTGSSSAGWCAAAPGGCATGSATTSRATPACSGPGTAAEYVDQLTTLLPRGQGRRPGRGGRARRLRLRRVQQRARQRAAAVLRPPRRARAGTPSTCSACTCTATRASVPDYLDTARQFMRAHGYLKPVVAGEHAGPQPFEFPEAMAVMQQVFAAAFTEAPAPQSTDELAARAQPGHPRAAGDGRALRADGRAAAAAADVPGRLPGRAGGQAAPDQLPPAGHAHPAGAGRRRPPDRVLEPRPRGTPGPARPPAR